MVPERQFLATALWHSVGQASVEQVEREAACGDLITGDRDGRRMVTTRDVLDEERRVIAFARDGRGPARRLPVNMTSTSASGSMTHKNGRCAIWSSRATGCWFVRGAAGVGKTELMKGDG